MKYSYILLAVSILLTVSVSLGINMCSQCISLNQVCEPSTSICPKGSHCSSKNGSFVCTEIPNAIGQDCTDSCSNNLVCNSTTKKCAATQYLGWGEKCDSDVQCTSDLTCVSGACNNTKYPTCTNRGGCNTNETCIVGTCAAPIADGKACSLPDDCMEDHPCINDLCVAPMSVAENGACLLTTDCDLTKNLVCDKNKCVPWNNNMACNTTVQDSCPSFSICRCNDNNKVDGQGTCKMALDIGGGAVSQFQTYMKCRADSKCPFVNFIQPQSCLYKCGNPLESNVVDPCSNSGSNIAINTFMLISIVLVSLLTL